MRREDCGNCHVLSSATFQFCPYCGEDKQASRDVYWESLDLQDVSQTETVQRVIQPTPTCPKGPAPNTRTR